MALPDIAVPAAVALIAGSTGDPAPRHLEQAIAVRRALPAALQASAEQPEHAQALLLALVDLRQPRRARAAAGMGARQAGQCHGR